MNASKEECRVAQRALNNVERAVEGEAVESDIDVVRAFLLKAERKLPHETTFAKEKLGCIRVDVDRKPTVK
jgi:hypothetical protein